MRELAAIASRLASEDRPSVLATLVRVEGSSYRRPGARMLLLADGSRLGSISGGCLEEDLVERAMGVRITGTPELATYDTTRDEDLAWGVGLGCHGVVHVLLERLKPRPAWAATLERNLREGRPTGIAVRWQGPAPNLGTRLAGKADPEKGVFSEEVAPPRVLWIFGAGDDAQPLARMALELGWKVGVADPRGAKATAARFPGTTLVVAPAEALVQKASLAPGSAAVVMTHHYRHDVPILRDLLPLSLAYLGLLGPRKRADRILADLGRAWDDGADPRGSLHAPVGLDLGAETPEEVALSILSEIQAVFAGRDAQPLRERLTPIHG